MSLRTSGTGLEVLAALLALRGRPARLAPALDAALPVHASDAASAQALAAALVAATSSSLPRPTATSPAARFLHRFRRRTLGGRVVAEPQRPSPPLGAWRSSAALAPDAVDALLAIERDRAEIATALRVTAARTLRREVAGFALARRRLEAEGAAAASALALALAERLVGEISTGAPERLAAWIRAEAATCAPEVPVGVRVAPEAVAAVEAALAGAGVECIVSPDSGLAAGDFVLDTAHGRRDGRIRTRLAALLAAEVPP